MTRVAQRKIQFPITEDEQLDPHTPPRPILKVVEPFTFKRKSVLTRERMKSSFSKLRTRRDFSHKAWFNWLCLGFLFIYLIIFSS